MQFCIRDDDTSFFTSPEWLERVYGDVLGRGPISLAVVPFHRAGTSKGVPERYRRKWSIHPLHDNRELVDYLRRQVAAGRYEVMLHGYYHDEQHGQPEFRSGSDLIRLVSHGRRYLEDLLGCQVRVFVPPHNAIGAEGLRAVAREGLHLGAAAGVRSGWPIFSAKTWRLWFQLRKWRRQGGVGIPWVLELDDHREISGTPVTPLASVAANEAILKAAIAVDGVFCAATHYWELETASQHPHEPGVGEHLRRLIDLAMSSPAVRWRSVGDVLSTPR